MEKSENTENIFRKLFGDSIDELNEDQKLYFYKLFMEYFIYGRTEHKYLLPENLLKESFSKTRLFLSYNQDKGYEDATKKYTWPGALSADGLSSLLNDEEESLNKLDEINKSIELLSATIKKSQYEQNQALLVLNEKIDKVIFKTTSLSAEIHERLIPESFGIDPDDYPISKFIPIKVYLSEYPDSHITEIITAIGEFIDSLGFLFVDEFPSQRGSWWKSWFGKSKEVMTSEEFTDRLKKGERAIELAALDKVQSEVNKNNAEAASNLIGALDNYDNGALQIGSLLLIKVTNGGTKSIHTRQLTNKEMILLEKNPSLIRQPTLIIEKLEELSCETVD